ncbi:MAG: lipopolysaccharide biosynthesis protein [Bacteroidales bacterium]|nr:lipopolysaccharide biosynthesis protein [Bacteroidales bacterium]
MSGKLVKSFFWNLVEILSTQIVNLVSMLVLSHLLLPEQFGLIATCSIFVAVSQVLIDGGFTQALIRKQDCTQDDYSTVFFFNLALSLLLYLLLFWAAPTIATFYSQPELCRVLRVLMLVLPIASISIIQRTILVKQYQFRIQTIVNFVAVTLGFVVALVMALKGYGVWSIVCKQVLIQVVISVGYWIVGKWRPVMSFSWSHFKALFGFGSRLMVVNTLSTLFSNVYKHVIAKCYSQKELGYYDRADVLTSVLTNIFTTMLNKVGYNSLSEKQDDNQLFVDALRRMMQPFYYVVFTVFAVLVATSHDLIPALLGDVWQPSSYYFGMISVGYAAIVMHITNQLIMNVKGCSNYFLRTEIVKYLLFIPVIFLGIRFGIKVLIVAFVIHLWLGFPINAWYSKRLVNYGIGAQIKDMAAPLAFAVTVALLVATLRLLPIHSHWLMVVVQGVVAIVLIAVLMIVFKIEVFTQLKQMLYSQFRSKKQ